MRARTAFFVMVAFATIAIAAAYEFGLVTEAAFAPSAPSVSPPVNGTLRLHFVDVGQGDAVVWQLPDGALAIWDCGPPAASPEENPLVAYLRGPLGLADGAPIALLAASHGHSDHIGGCDEVFDTFDVAAVADAGYEGDDRPLAYRRFQEAVRLEGATLLQPRAGGTLPLPGLEVSVLWPREGAPSWERIANHGLVVRLAWGSTSACFQGDIEEAQERVLADSVTDASCDVLLMGHHGSRSASTTRWLARAQPTLMLVSHSATNAYGHPHPEAVCRAQQAGASVLSTAALGDIVVDLDGTSVRARPEGPALATAC